LGEYQESLAGELGVQPNEIAMGESPGVNSLVSPVSSNTVPQMHIKEGCVRIARREFIATIDIRDAGLTRSYAINPGRRFFPWMHSVARNFQQFQFLGFAAEYVPTSGYAVASTNAALGQVAMCFNYNTIKENFVASWPLTDLAGLLNMSGSVSTSPAAPAACYMECDPAMSNQPVRFVWDESEGADLSLFYSQQNLDAADLLIRTEGAQNLTPFQAGQLWFTYEVLLMQPRPQQIYFMTTGGPYKEALREWIELTNLLCALTDVQAIRVSERTRLLETVFRSAKYQDWLAENIATQQLRRLTEEKEPPALTASVRNLIAQAAEEDASLFPRPPPSSPTPSSWAMAEEGLTAGMRSNNLALVSSARR
jgi:hypothetical protein